MVELFADNGDLDQMPHSLASGLGCTVCHYPFKGLQTTMG